MKKSLPSAHAPMCTVRRALVAEIDEAAAQLQHAVPSDRAIHSVRVKLKRSRAALRLLRTCIGTETYRGHNLRIRDAARPLTKARDSRVLVQTLRDLELDAAQNRPGALKPGPINSFLRLLGRELRRQRGQQRKGVNHSHLQAAAAALRGVKRRLQSIPDTRLARGVLGEALERAYRAAYRAYGRTLLLPTDERLHEWRRQTKYFLNQLDIVSALESSRIAKHRKRARRLARCLGDDHDLALLHAQVLKYAKGANAPARNAEAADLLRRIERRRRSLQREARDLGRCLYAVKPAYMRRQFEKKLGASRAAAPAA